jgi:hypothetical protein
MSREITFAHENGIRLKYIREYEYEKYMTEGDILNNENKIC